MNNLLQNTIDFLQAHKRIFHLCGHWETFAGIDWRVVKPLKLSVNFVNVLFQNGAKGSIDVADTITDASMLNNYVMSGSYIRPFTIDFMLTYSF